MLLCTDLLQEDLSRISRWLNDVLSGLEADEVRQQLDESVARLEEIKQKIIKQGEIRKKEIIHEARAESKILLLEAKRRIDTQILSTKKMFQIEMIDEAMNTVFEKLPQHITQADNQNFLDQYLTRISSD